MTQVSLDRFFELMRSEGVHPAPDRVRFWFKQFFRRTDLLDKTVLDVGGGTGILTLYAAASGASRALCLEPEGAGSTHNDAAKFSKFREAGSFYAAQLLPSTFQQYAACSNETFDCVVCQSAINHLDEVAVAELHRSEEAQETYRALLLQIRGLLVEDGILIISDAMRRNMFGDLGVKSPICPSMEWHKHQNPALWIRLVEQCGFKCVRREWRTFNRFGDGGRWLFGNALFAYAFGSSFIIEFRAT